MKTIKLLLAAVLLLGVFTSVNAQTNHFDKVMNFKKKQVFVGQQEGAKYIVEVPNKTKEELYEMVMLAIADQWVNPDEVINGTLEGSYIKVGGQTASFGAKNGWVELSFFTKINYHFRFKDGKFMYSFNLSFTIPPSQYVSGGVTSLSSIQMTKKNGKKAYTHKYRDIYNDEVNSFIELIKSKGNSDNNSEW